MIWEPLSHKAPFLNFKNLILFLLILIFFFWNVSRRHFERSSTNRFTLTCSSNFRVTGNEMRDLRLASPSGHSTQRLISPVGHLRVASLNDHRVSSPSDSEIHVHSPSKFSSPFLWQRICNLFVPSSDTFPIFIENLTPYGPTKLLIACGNFVDLGNPALWKRNFSFSRGLEDS